MSSGLYSHTSRATGTVLTAAIYNADHSNHITNQNPSMTGAYSDSLAQHQLNSDPGGLGSEVMAGSLAVEIEHLRFCIKRITGASQWYVAPPTDLTAGAANDSITNAKLANMAAGTYKMRVTASTGDPEDATAAQATAGLNAFVGDSGSGGTKGLVPAPATGDAAAGKLLSADGTFRAPATQAVMEAATSVVDHVPPARQHFHPGHPKCWLMATVSGGVPTLQNSHNITSITDTALGQLSVTIGTDFSSANWCCVPGLAGHTSAEVNNVDREYPTVQNGSQTAGAVILEATVGVGGSGDDLRFQDPAVWYMMGLGDQA